MAKKTRRRASAARDQLGCMWGFMNMFTFRHGPLSHKLLLEPNHAAGSPRNNERDKSNDKDAQETHVGEERNVTITIIKPSVKKLIAEELLNDKKQRENAEAGQLSDSELEGRRRKNHKRKNKTRKNSCGDFSPILKTADTEVPKKNDDKECEEDRIFILKPRSASFSSLSPDSHLILRNNKTQQERNTSHFFLSKIKRKLKQAIRKEGEWYPTKDHFFLERMAKPSTKSHKDDKKQKVSIEAKKHLSEMLNNGDVVDSNSTSRQFLQNSSLGTILSLPEYLSPLRSPWEKSSPSHRKSASADFINALHISKREPYVSLPNHAMKNDDLPVCDLSKEPTESVGIEEGTANEDKLSAADDVMITNEIDTVPEEASCTFLSDLPKAEAHAEHRDGTISKQAAHEERQPPLSPSVPSPSHCLVKGEECKSAAHDVQEWSSPVSVLEPLFIEDDISPPKMRSQSDDEAQVQPWCIHFDDKEDSAVKTIITSDKELVFKYVRDVLDAVVSDFEELYLKAQFSDQLLEPSLISNIPFCPNQLCHDHELLFDCINEVIMELCCCPPWASFVAPRRTRVFSTVKSIVHEVQEAVYWHLSPMPLPRALDQIVRKDMAKSGNWLDIRCDIDSIGFETSELILEELLEELITLNCLNNSEHFLVPGFQLS